MKDVTTKVEQTKEGEDTGHPDRTSEEDGGDEEHHQSRTDAYDIKEANMKDAPPKPIEDPNMCQKQCKNMKDVTKEADQSKKGEDAGHLNGTSKADGRDEEHHQSQTDAYGTKEVHMKDAPPKPIDDVNLMEVDQQSLQIDTNENQTKIEAQENVNVTSTAQADPVSNIETLPSEDAVKAIGFPSAQIVIEPAEGTLGMGKEVILKEKSEDD